MGSRPVGRSTPTPASARHLLDGRDAAADPERAGGAREHQGREPAEDTPRCRASGGRADEDEGAPETVAVHPGARASSAAALDPGNVAMRPPACRQTPRAMPSSARWSDSTSGGVITGRRTQSGSRRLVTRPACSAMRPRAGRRRHPRLRGLVLLPPWASVAPAGLTGGEHVTLPADPHARSVWRPSSVSLDEP